MDLCTCLGNTVHAQSWGSLVTARRGEGRVSARAVFAYGAALAMAPYLLIKISWVVGALVGLLPRTERLSVAGFVVLNTVTIGMSACGIALALALVRPWGERIPAFVVLSCAWVGCGFLVPMIPYAVLDTLLSAGDEASGNDAAVMPNWEASLIQISFIGMGVGLAVALPFYLRARWPAAFVGHVGDGMASARPHSMLRPGAMVLALAGALVVGVLDLYWAAGGTIGLRHPAARELTWYLQAGNAGIWSLAGAWGVLVIARGRPAVPLWMPVSVSWLTSGFLVAWGGWKLPFAVYQAVEPEPSTVWPEQLGVASAQFLLSVVAGTAMLNTVVRTYRARRHDHDALFPAKS
jgi:hypothetical protein